MNDKLKNREIRKIYWLIISNKFDSNEGLLEGWFKKIANRINLIFLKMSNLILNMVH